MSVQETIPTNVARALVPPLLRGRHKITPSSQTLTVDAGMLSEEARNILAIVANGDSLPNLDPLLYTSENADNWAEVAKTSHNNDDEVEVIMRAATAHAVWLSPPEDLGLWSIGAATTFNLKERVVIEEHVKEGRGHNFKFWAYSDVNLDSLKQSVEDGKKLAEELGLNNIEHIPLLGDVFNAEVRKRNKEVLAKQGARVLTTCFGYTLQNLQHRVTGYKQATDELTEALKVLRNTVPKGSVLFGTFGHEKDKEKARAPYITKEGEKFVRDGARQYLGDVVDITDYNPRFVGSTTVLERPLKLNEQVVVDFGSDGTTVIPKGTDIWMGISARQPDSYVGKAFNNAGFVQVLPEPFYNKPRTLTCQVAYKR